MVKEKEARNSKIQKREMNSTRPMLFVGERRGLKIKINFEKLMSSVRIVKKRKEFGHGEKEEEILEREVPERGERERERVKMKTKIKKKWIDVEGEE